MSTPNPSVAALERAGELHDEVHEAAALVDYHTKVEIGWAPEEAIPILTEALGAVYLMGREDAVWVEAHETNYRQTPTGGWVWTCRCQAGTPLFLPFDTRDECVQQTRLHWGGAIRDAIRRTSGGKE